MNWRSQLNGDPLPWLLEPSGPGPRYLALRDLVGLVPADPELIAAQKAAHTGGPIAAILKEMDPQGYWVRPGPGYNPKYYSAIWSLTSLAQLGASVNMDTRISVACLYALDKGLTPLGQYSMTGKPSGTIDCLQGNLLSALVALGYDDPRLDQAYEWMARSVTGEGLAPASEREAALRFYSAKCGPLFACGYNGARPCAWGAVKVMLAFAGLPEERRSPLIQRAIQKGVDFLLGTDPAMAEYPTRTDGKPNRSWWKFGFPVFYVTDLLQLAEALLPFGCAADLRLSNALQLIRNKQDSQGRWSLEYGYAGKTWVNFGELKQPNKWVTLRALRVLKAAAG